jgi:predicted O-methyltransferase YrrM
MAELMQRELAGVTILEVDSHEVNWTEMADQYFDGQGVDFAFIDGDHSEEGCYQDLTGVMWIMRPGGLIVVDDYMSGLPNGVPFESVNRAVHRFVKENSLSLKRWFDNGKGMAIISI